MPFRRRNATLSFHPALNVPALTIAVSSPRRARRLASSPAIQLTRTLDVRGALAGGSAAGPQRGRRQRRFLVAVAIAAGFFIIATMFVVLDRGGAP